MRLIRLKEVMDKTALSRASVYRFVAEGRFPKQVSLGENSVAWVEEEVDDWITDRVNSRE